MKYIYLQSKFFFGFSLIVLFLTSSLFFSWKKPADIVLQKTTFSSQENVVFFIPDDEDSFHVQLEGPQGQDVPTQLVFKKSSPEKISFLPIPSALANGIFGENSTSSRLELTRPDDFHPGKYHAHITDKAGKTKEMDFYWGVLGVNFDASSYRPGRQVEAQFSVLDSMGQTVCDATLEAEVIHPDGKTVSLSTQERTIVMNPNCGDQTVSAPPDYRTFYRPEKEGTYEMRIRYHFTENGEEKEGNTQEFFTVKNETPFTVKRHGPTRIYPPNTYPFRIEITGQEKWQGEIREKIPSDFKIQNISAGGIIKETDGQRWIVWPTSLEKEQKKTFSYDFQAPFRSPDFFTLGPLKLQQKNSTQTFEETRFWQIASDAQTRRTCNWIGSVSNAWGTAGNWSCNFVPDNASCSGGSNGTCYYVSIENTTNNPVLLGSTSRTVSAFEIGTSTNSTSMTIDSSGSLTVQAEGGSVGGYTVGTIEIGSGSTTGTLNLNPITPGTCLTTAASSSFTPIKTSGTITSSNSQCTWSHTGTSGTITNAGTMSGSFSLSVTSGASFTNTGTMSMTGGTFTTGGGADVNCSNATRSNNKFYNFSTGTPSAITTLSGSCLIGGVLTVANSTLSTGSGTHELSGSGTPLVINGASGVFSASATNTMIYSGTSATNIAAASYSNLNVQPTSGSPTYTFATSQTTTVNADLTIGDGTNAVTASTGTAGSDPSIDAKDDVTMNANATLSGAGGGNITVNGNVTGGGTVNLTAGTFEQRVGAAKNFGTTAGSNNWTFNNLTFSNSAATSSTITTQTVGTGGITISGTLTVGKSGDSTATILDAKNRAWTLAGTTSTPLVLNTVPAGSITASTSTINYTAGAAAGATVAAMTYNNLGVGTTQDTSSAFTYTLGGTTSVGGTLTVGNASSTNTDTLNGSSYTLTLSGSDTPLTITSKGTFSPSNSTVSYENTSSATVAAASYYNLQFNPASGTPTYTIASGTLTAANNVTLTGSGNGTVDANTNDPSLTVTGNLTIGSGDTFQASNSGTFNLAGNLTNSGTFTANSGTLTVNGSGTSSFSGSTTFYHLTSTTAGKTIRFQKATSGTPLFSFGGTLTLTGTSGSKITLRSSESDSQWLANFSSNQSAVTYTDIADAGCQSGSATVQLDSTATNNGNNGSCWSFNQSPTTPSSLAQKKTTNTAITTGGWNGSTSVKFTANLSDPDSSDTLALCVEAKALGTAFTDTENSCGTAVTYSGTAVSGSVTLTLTTNTAYHWQARTRDTAGTYSSWTSFGSNSESSRDFGIDTTAPTAGSVYDGDQTDTDQDFNDGSLSKLSGNWSGFSDALSEIALYEYSIGTTAGATDLITWTENSTTKSTALTGLTLHTGITYYFNVRATDTAGNVSSIASSDGIRVLPLPPTSGFSPNEGARTSAQKPTLSWNTPGDPDVSYKVCLSTSQNPSEHCDYTYTSASGKTQVTVSDELTDETTYYWQVRAVDALSTTSSWSAGQSFYVNASLDPKITLTKSITINAADTEGTLSTSRDHLIHRPLSQFLISWMGIRPASAAWSTARIMEQQNVQTTLQTLVIKPHLFYLALVVFLIGLLHILRVVKHPAHIPLIILSPTWKSFEKIAQKKENGTFQSSYLEHRKYTLYSRFSFITASFIFIIKIILGITVSGFLIQPGPVRGSTDDTNPVKPYDTLTYRVDWKNSGDGAATSFILTDSFPTDTTPVSESARINGSGRTDANDSDEVTVTSSGINFSLGTLAESGAEDKTDTGYVSFLVKVKTPTDQTSINNTASFTYSESETASTTNTTTNPVTSFSISGFLYNDANKNETKDRSEKGISRVSVHLYEDTDQDGTFTKEKDTLLSSKKTDGNGKYTVSGLGSFTYFVLVDEKTLPSTSWKGTTTKGNPKKVIIESEDSANQNFGYYDNSKQEEKEKNEKSSIGDLVWNDINRNGTINKNEEGISGVKISLYKNTDASRSELDKNKDTLIGEKTSDDKGRYLFDNLDQGTYFILTDERSEILNRKNFTLTTDNNPKKITVNGGTEYGAADFGFGLPTSRIGDLVFEDTNGNGQPEANENGLSNITIQLFSDSNGSGSFDDNNDTLITSTKTGTFGLYNFRNLGRGVYFARVDESTLPLSTYVLTTSKNPVKIMITTDTAQKFLSADFGYRKKSTEELSEEETEKISSDMQKLLLNDIYVNNEPAIVDGKVISSTFQTPTQSKSIKVSGSAENCASCKVSLKLSGQEGQYETVTNEQGVWEIEIPVSHLSSGENPIVLTLQKNGDGSNETQVGTILYTPLTEKITPVLPWIFLVLLVLILIVIFWFGRRDDNFLTAGKKRR